MFDLGIQELVVIFIVALIVFGPKRLPELGKTLGRGILELRKAMEGIRDQVHAESEAISRQEESAGEDRERKDETSPGSPQPSVPPEAPYGNGEEKSGEDTAEGTGQTVKTLPEGREEDKVDNR